MKKIKILALILSTTIASTSLSGCFKKDEAAPVNTEVIPSHPNNNTNTVNTDTDNTSKNTPIVVTEQGKYVGQDISLDTRIFTYNGFSVATKNKYDDGEIYISEGSITDIKSELVSNLNDMTDLENSSLFGSAEGIEENSLTFMLSQMLMINIIMYTYMQNDDSFLNNDAEFIDNILIIEENMHTMDNQTVKQTSISLDFGDLENEEYQEYLNQTIEVFTLPYKDDDNQFYSIIFFKNKNNNDVLIDIESMLDTFIYDNDLVELNNDGKSKFKFVSFTAYIDQKYVQNQVLIPYLKSFGTDVTSNHLSLNFTDESLQESTYFSSDFTSYSSLGEDILEVGTNKFGINRVEVDVQLDNGEIVKDSLITAIVHTADEIDGFYTTIKFRSFNIEIDDYTFNKHDFDMLNTVFIDIMNRYEISLSVDALWYMDMSNEMDRSYKEQQETAYNNKLERSIEVVTDAGFTTRYDPSNCRPKNNAVNGVPVDDAVIGMYVDVGVINPSINFLVRENDDIINHKSFLAPSQTELSWMSDEHIDRLNSCIDEMEYELTTDILELGDKTVTKEFYSITQEVMDEYTKVFFGDEHTNMGGDEFRAVIYSYEVDDMTYVMYSRSSNGFIDSTVTREIEFMMRNLSIE